MKPKNNRSLTTKLITVLFSAAVVVYFAVEAWNYFTVSVDTVSVYTYRAEHSVALDGKLVRDEEAVACGDTLVELSRAEGERVGKGKPLATVYSSSRALSDAQTLAALREQLSQLEYARDVSSDAESALRLDTEIEGELIALRAALASGNYAALESGASALRGTVLRREYAYRGGADLSGRIAALEEQIAALNAQLGGTAHTITAPFAGTYSTVSDGWESVLTPQALRDLTPASFERMAPAADGSAVGKLIRGDTWYYAAVIDAAEAGGIEQGKRYSLLISGVEETLPVRVYSLTQPQDGRCLLVLKSDRYLSLVTMLRAQSAELILESHEGLRVPKNALRIDENGVSGVYCLVGRIACFKPVELIFQGEDYCLVRPGEIHASRDSDVVLYTLRAGDEVIVTATGLYDGKVVK